MVVPALRGIEKAVARLGYPIKPYTLQPEEIRGQEAVKKLVSPVHSTGFQTVDGVGSVVGDDSVVDDLWDELCS